MYADSKMLCCGMVWYDILCFVGCDVLCCVNAVLCHAKLCRVVLCCAMLCCAALRCAVLCCAVLCCTDESMTEGEVQALIGGTILSWGTTVPELVATYTLAKMGHSTMAIAGCFAGPVFNLMVGLGLPVLCGIMLLVIQSIVVLAPACLCSAIGICLAAAATNWVLVCWWCMPCSRWCLLVVRSGRK